MRVFLAVRFDERAEGDLLRFAALLGFGQTALSHALGASFLDILLRLPLLLGRFVGPEEALADLRLVHHHLERIESESENENESADKKSERFLRRGSEELYERAVLRWSPVAE